MPGRSWNVLGTHVHLDAVQLIFCRIVRFISKKTDLAMHRLLVLLALLMTVAAAFRRQSQETPAVVAVQGAPNRVVQRRLGIITKTLNSLDSLGRSNVVRAVHNTVSSIKARFTPPTKTHHTRAAIKAKARSVAGKV
ncbi:hypothetical protein LEN26_000841 [Aphanomyces euteiches]|nr:hypothetical protein AeMF1_012880 [Aphanomyces euteiches]KAH9162637.1 hypothetical protein LEN26_000841 [Aphanomyces euteiches]KAH9181198.1 hypothetical protein AeNC1_016826 [Aphanomyces euteiches]